MHVKLQAVIDAISLTFEDQRQFINLETGEIVLVQNEHFCVAEEIHDAGRFEYPIEWEKDAILTAYDILVSEDKYLPLPDKYEINEYEIMESFCLQLRASSSEEFLDAIRGRGAFRRFRDLLNRYSMLEQWYSFEQEALTEVARNWCVKNSLPCE